MHYKNTIIFLIALVLTSCSIFKPVVVEKIKEVHVVDKEYVRDTMVLTETRKEYVRDYTGLLDTLRISTEYSLFSAAVDTSASKLVGEARNRDKVPMKVQYRDRVIVRDSIITKEVPVPVEVVREVVKIPWLYKVFAAIGAIALLAGAVWLFFKLKPML